MDVWNTLNRLARAWPDVTWVLTGRNSGDRPEDVGLPGNVENPWADGLADEIREVGKGRSSPMTVPERYHVVRETHRLTGPLFEKCDGHVVWAGQQGTSNLPIPKTGFPLDGNPDNLTNTQDAFVLYGSYIDLGINLWRHPDPVNREEVWLCPDPRNYLKSRSVRWPLLRPVVSQFDETRPWKHERYIMNEELDEPWRSVVTNVHDGHVWAARTAYRYEALEHTALPDPDPEARWSDGTRRAAFGIVVNENRPYVANSRLKALQQWVLPWYQDVPIIGTWTDKSKEILGRDPRPVPVSEVIETIAQWRGTFTMPASGSGWATAKPWECFLAGTVCFFHPKYDTQGHIVPTLQQLKTGEVPEAWRSDDRQRLARWLRPPNPDALLKAARAVATSEETWRWLALQQADLLREAWNERQVLGVIEERLGLGGAGS